LNNSNLTESIITGESQLTFFDEIIALRRQVWPNFIRVPDENVLTLYERFPNFQISLKDPTTQELMGIANSIPLIWRQSLLKLPNEGVTWAMHSGLSDHNHYHNHDQVEAPNVLCLISMSIAKGHRNTGISKIFLKYLKNLANQMNFTSMIAPVRPTKKSLYPFIPIDKYIGWKNDENFHYDPWLKTHLSLGARIVKICDRSACVIAPIEQWEQWTGLRFPSDGAYLVEGALTPVEIDHSKNLGTYIEPNVWVATEM
jgi:hypothetical protein